MEPYVSKAALQHNNHHSHPAMSYTFYFVLFFVVFLSLLLILFHWTCEEISLEIQAGPSPETGLVIKPFYSISLSTRELQVSLQQRAGTSLGVRWQFLTTVSTLPHTVYLVPPSHPHIPGREAE